MKHKTSHDYYREMLHQAKQIQYCDTPRQVRYRQTRGGVLLGKAISMYRIEHNEHDTDELTIIKKLTDHELRN